ncbi:MAG: integration host factor subunit beta [Proteobacteria bacterium]|nr:integration host factor subunit beta [Pseudomonadota bacterium]
MKAETDLFSEEETDRQKHKVARETVNLFFNGIKDALKEGDRFEIRGFGSFYVREYDGYTGRNPKTDEKVDVKPKKLPVFRPGKELKEMVDG